MLAQKFGALPVAAPGQNEGADLAQVTTMFGGVYPCKAWKMCWAAIRWVDLHRR